jgi:hypothetical protein
MGVARLLELWELLRYEYTMRGALSASTSSRPAVTDHHDRRFTGFIGVHTSRWMQVLKVAVATGSVQSVFGWYSLAGNVFMSCQYVCRNAGKLWAQRPIVVVAVRRPGCGTWS